MFRIAWRSAHNSGYGEYCLDENSAKTCVENMNKKYIGEIQHWIEEKPK
jgi:hypothetical protein